MAPSAALELYRDQIRLIVEANNATNPRVFGSAAAGADTEEGDLDLLVDPTSKMSLFDLASIKIEVEQLLGVRIDVLTPDSLSDSYRDEVIRDSLAV